MNKNLKITLATVLFTGLVGCSHADDRKGPPGGGERPDFSSIDTDGNGYIDFEEFSVQKLRGGDHQTVFDSIDADSDGQITEQEFSDHKPPRPPRD